MIQEEDVLNIFMQSVNPGVVIDDNGFFIAVNESALQALGYNLNDNWRELNISTFTLKEGIDIVSAWKAVVRTEKKIEGTSLVKSKEGDVIVAEYRAILNVKPGWHWFTFKDITKEAVDLKVQKLISDVLKISSKSNSYKKAISNILKLLVNELELITGELYLLNESKDRLVQQGVYGNVKAPNFSLYVEQVKGTSIALNEESLRMEIYKKETLFFIPDLLKMEGFTRTSFLPKTGVFPAFFVPVHNTTGLIGGFFFIKEEKGDFDFVKNKILEEQFEKLAAIIGSELNQIKARYELGRIYESSSDLIAVLGFGGVHFTRVNPAFEKTLGYSWKELKQINANKLIDKASLKQVDNLIKAARKGKGFKMKELLFNTKNGEKLWIEWSGISDIHNEIIYLIGRNITQHKTDEQKLFRANRKFKLATSTAKMGIWRWDALKDEVFWDEGIRNIYGVKKSGVPQTPAEWSPFLMESDLKRVTKAFRKALEEGKKLEIKHPIVSHYGRLKYVQNTADVWCDDDGTKRGLIGVCFDITDLVLAEKQKARALDQLKKRMAEQHCLYSISAIQNDGNLTELYQRVTNQISDGFTCPHLVEVKISFADLIVETPGFRTSPYHILVEADVKGKSLLLEVIYTENVLDAEKPFLIEEKKLVEAVLDYLTKQTESFLQRQELVESEERIRTFIENSPVATWIQDENFTTIAANEVFLTERALTKQDVGRKKTKEELAAIPRFIRENTQLVFDSKTPFRFIEEMINPRGETHIYEVYRFIIKVKGGDLLAGFALDITESYRQNESIKKQNSLLREIAYVQSHVVRAPLARLLGLTELFEVAVKDGNALEFASYIHDSANELDKIIQEMVKTASQYRDES